MYCSKFNVFYAFLEQPRAGGGTDARAALLKKTELLDLLAVFDPLILAPLILLCYKS